MVIQNMDRRKEETLLGKIKTQLVSKEDPFHVHKTLGVLCLLSYFWRFSQFRIDNADDMGFAKGSKYHSFTLPTLLLHLLLSTSSLLFKIPRMRIKSGTRIWPEMRLHSIVFASRGIACMLLNYYEEEAAQEPNYLWNLVIVLAAMALADLASWSVGKEYQSNSIRGVAGAPPFSKLVASYAQFNGTAFCLFGLRRYSSHFMMMTLIQSTSFMMTLRRKNLVSDFAVVAIYGAHLVISFTAHHLSELPFMPYQAAAKGHLILVISFVAFMWRMGVPKPFNNKYIIWSTMGLVLHLIRSNKDLYQRIETEPKLVLPFVAITVLNFFAFAFFKCYSEYNEKERKTLTQMFVFKEKTKTI